jgi:hypothetical protein
VSPVKCSPSNPYPLPFNHHRRRPLSPRSPSPPLPSLCTNATDRTMCDYVCLCVSWWRWVCMGAVASPSGSWTSTPKVRLYVYVYVYTYIYTPLSFI